MNFEGFIYKRPQLAYNSTIHSLKVVYLTLYIPNLFLLNILFSPVVFHFPHHCSIRYAHERLYLHKFQRIVEDSATCIIVTSLHSCIFFHRIYYTCYFTFSSNHQRYWIINSSCLTDFLHPLKQLLNTSLN